MVGERLWGGLGGEGMGDSGEKVGKGVKSGL
jgi:hypothetical protein